MPTIDLAKVPARKGSRYPAPFDEPCRERVRHALGDAGGLTQFGVNLLTLPPGAWSSQRHWHDGEDEFVFVLAGDVVLVTDTGKEILGPGACAAFAKGDGNGHQLINRGKAPAMVLEVGSRKGADTVHYPGIDLVWDGPKEAYTHCDGTPYPAQG
jgi:uncharacterized cupin superfamily protein